MPELEITDEQAAFLDSLREAIEDELVGPYGTVHRRDALQYLIDNYGEPDELLSDGSPADVASPEADTVAEGRVGDGSDGDAEGDADADDTDAGADDATDDEEASESGGGGGGGIPTPGGGGGDGMLDEMMALLEEHDDKWTEADSEETKYEVDLPDGSTETVQTQDDVRAILFKNYR